MLDFPYDDGFLMDTKKKKKIFVRDHSMIIHGQLVLVSIKFLVSEFFVQFPTWFYHKLCLVMVTILKF